MKVYVSCITRAKPFWDMMTHFLHAAAVAQSKGIVPMLDPHVGDSLVSRARNEAMFNFLQEKDAEYLLTLDDDIRLHPNTFEKLIKADKDIVGGIYRLKTDSKLKAAMRGISPFQIKDYPDQVKEVMYLSAGCMMIKRSVVEGLYSKYKELTYFANEVDAGENERRALYMPFIHKGEYLSEDWAFCQRAKFKGYKIYVHTGVTCGHTGLKNYDFHEEIMG